MIIGFKDIFKMLGILLVSFCAVFVCTLFLNYNLDLAGIDGEVTAGAMQIFYDAQIMSGKVVSSVSGGCLLLTSVVMLYFYIGHYIEMHKKELGILKALGYSRIRIAKEFWVFGISVFAGTCTGYFAAHLLMPRFYEVQNQEGLLPEFGVQFHAGLFLVLCILPSVLFSLLSVWCGFHKMKVSALDLLCGREQVKVKAGGTDKGLPFLQELKRETVRQKKSLVFFIAFAVFCFSSMMQMSLAIDELASKMMSVMTMGIGMVLSCTILLIAVSSVVRANGKAVMMMKAFGYRQKECSRAVLGGYRPWAYLGFVLGTGYQYMLLKLAVTVIFRDVENVAAYHFHVPEMAVAFAAFVVLYESTMYGYAKGMNRISVKEIMAESY